MKKFFIITAACMLLFSFALIPSGTPIEAVREWLATEAIALAALYFVLSSLGKEKSNR